MTVVNAWALKCNHNFIYTVYEKVYAQIRHLRNKETKKWLKKPSKLKKNHWICSPPVSGSSMKNQDKGEKKNSGYTKRRVFKKELFWINKGAAGTRSKKKISSMCLQSVQWNLLREELNDCFLQNWDTVPLRKKKISSLVEENEATGLSRTTAHQMGLKGIELLSVSLDQDLVLFLPVDLSGVKVPSVVGEHKPGTVKWTHQTTLWPSLLYLQNKGFQHMYATFLEAHGWARVVVEEQGEGLSPSERPLGVTCTERPRCVHKQRAITENSLSLIFSLSFSLSLRFYKYSPFFASVTLGAICWKGRSCDLSEKEKKIPTRAMGAPINYLAWGTKIARVDSINQTIRRTTPPDPPPRPRSGPGSGDHRLLQFVSLHGFISEEEINEHS